MTDRTTNQGKLGLRLTAALLATAAPAAAFAQAAAPAPAVPAPPVLQTLSQIPGVTVQYYDIAGKTIPELNASIMAQRPPAADGRPNPSSASWSIGTSIRKATTGNTCKIVGASPRFTGTVVLPRLASTEGVPEPVLKQWQNYVANLEHQQAVALRQPYDRLREVEQAALASTCEGASAAVNRAIELITLQPTPIAPVTP